MGVIEKLTNFTHKDANGRDWGLNVRQRAKELVALVTDTDRIRGERQKVGQPACHWAQNAEGLLVVSSGERPATVAVQSSEGGIPHQRCCAEIMLLHSWTHAV